jgi:hypothetical protein
MIVIKKKTQRMIKKKGRKGQEGGKEGGLLLEGKGTGKGKGGGKGEREEMGGSGKGREG